MRPYNPSPSIYVHIPFCVKACPYCNFNFRLLHNYEEKFLEDYVLALIHEWTLFQEVNGTFSNIQSLYFGGGTPSLLDPALIFKIIEDLNPNKNKEIEITLEANPDGFSKSDVFSCLKGFRQAGVNRLSLGVQSLNPKLLSRLGRTHSPAQVRDVIQTARKVGFSNISCDIMGALPEEDLCTFQKDVEDFLSLEIDHISFYSLTLEEKTLFDTLYKKGHLSLPSDDQQADFLRTARSGLKEGGFEPYEISNYAKKGYQSFHNLGYWSYRNYLGLGTGAHSFFRIKDGHKRTMNKKDPQQYVEEIGCRKIPKEFEEKILGKKAMGEFIFTGLRKQEGISFSDFEEIFSCEIVAPFAGEIEELQSLGLLHHYQKNSEDWLCLTNKGIFLSDSVFEYFV